jgi:hypothetical protein
MFSYKSEFRNNFKETFIDELAIWHFNKHALGIVQLEIVNVDNFLEDNLTKIKNILDELKGERSLELIFLSFVDIEEGFNKFVVIDEKTQRIIESLLDIEFDNNIAKNNINKIRFNKPAIYKLTIFKFSITDF